MSVAAVLGILAVLMVPGLPASLWVAPPGRLDPVTRVALVPVLGAVVAGGVAFILTVAGSLWAPAFMAGVLAASVALGLVVARRAGWRTHARSFAAQVRADPWPIALGALVLLGIAAVRWSFTPDVHFSAASAWRYWADAIEIADAHRVPAHSLQYGMPLVPTVSKVFLNALNAAFSFVAGRDALPALGALLWLGSVGLAAALWSVGRELGLRWTAPILALLLVANRTLLNPEITTDLDAYRAETFGRLIAFGGLALAVHAAGVAALMFATLLAAPRGDVGLTGARGDDVYARFGAGFDPTLFVNSGATPADQRARGPRDWSLTIGRATRAFVASVAGQKSTEGLRPHPPAPWLGGLEVALAGGFAAVAMVMLVWFPRPLRPLGLMAAGLAAVLVALTWWFSQRSRLFIPANFGLRRLYDYTALPVVLAGLGLAEGALLLLRRAHRWAPQVVATVLVVLTAAWLLPSARLQSARVRRALPIVEPMRWLAENVACDARILANQHSEGFFEAGLGRAGLLEGMTPYLRPDVLETTIPLFLDTRAFFAAPRRELLDRLGVTHLVTIRGAGIGYQAMIPKTDLEALDRAPFLRLLHSTPAVHIYQVVNPVEMGGPSEAAEFPGYRCARVPAF
ncbi:MAG: hypothetical protein LC722_01385 [Actinobacteria bacterium]|nr:hypothetical protein [Actinomycetota bacterium]